MDHDTPNYSADAVRKRRNFGRGLLAMQASLVFIAGMGMLLTPEQGCERWVSLRGVEPAAGACPQNDGQHAVAALYNFSLNKHHALLGIMFFYFATLGRSRDAINIGFVYFFAAMSLDSLPVYTWLSSTVELSFPPIARLGVLYGVISAAGIAMNVRHPEWSIQ